MKQANKSNRKPLCIPDVWMKCVKMHEIWDLQSVVAEDSGLAGMWRCFVGHVVSRFPNIVMPSSSGSSGLTMDMKMLRSLRTNSVQINTGYRAPERCWWKNFEIWIALKHISSLNPFIHACRWVQLTFGPGNVHLNSSTQAAQNFEGERFNLRKLKELEVKEKYQMEITNRFAALENLKMLTRM